MPEDEAPPQKLGLPGETLARGAVPYADALVAVAADPVDAVGSRVPPLPADREQAQAARLGRGPGRDWRRASYIADPGPMPEAEDPLLDFVPAPHSHPWRNSNMADRQRDFIAALAATGVVLQATAHIGAGPDRGRARCARYAGEDQLVVSAGKLPGHERRHNEAPVMFLLRNRRPERYGGSGRLPKLPLLVPGRGSGGLGTGSDAPPLPAAGPELPGAKLRGWKRVLLEQPDSLALRKFTRFELVQRVRMTAAQACTPAPVPDGLAD